jgi:hypothetical protein
MSQIFPLVYLMGGGAVALWGGYRVIAGLIRHPRAVYGRAIRRAISPAWIALSAALVVWIAFGIDSANPQQDTFFFGLNATRAVEGAIPLIMGLSAALIFVPGDEPAIEAQLACPRGIAWTILERLAGIAVAQFVVACGGMIVSAMLVPEQPLGAMIARWLPPAALLTGLAVFITFRARSTALGMALTVVVWFLLLAFAGYFLPDASPLPAPFHALQTALWSISPFAQPDALSAGDYALNRVIVAAVGLALLVVAIAPLGDEEYALLGQKAK